MSLQYTAKLSELLVTARVCLMTLTYFTQWASVSLRAACWYKERIEVGKWQITNRIMMPISMMEMLLFLLSWFS